MGDMLVAWVDRVGLCDPRCHMRGLTRPDGSRVMRYAPGDGHLSFGVADERGRSLPYDVTHREAEQLCPAGWTIYMDGPYHRARPLQPENR